MNKIILSVLLLCVFAAPAHAREGLLDIKEVKSTGGITAWLVEDHSVPVISIQFAFKGAGSVHDSKEKQGLAQMASNTMDEGAGELDSQAFQKKLQDLSIELRFSSGRDNFVGVLKTLTANKDEALELMRLALSNPRFDEEAIERMRASNQSRIKKSLTDPDWIAARIRNDKAFEGHPYALNSGGTLTSLEGITSEDLKGFVKSRLGKNNLVVAAAGDITAKKLASVIDELFGHLPDVSLAEVDDTDIKNQGQVFVFEKDIPQTIIDRTHPGIVYDDPDLFTAQVMNYILGGGGFGSRLMEEVREKRGLTYGIYSGMSHQDYANSINVSTSTSTENTKEVLTLIDQEWSKIKSEAVDEIDLKNAKAYLIGSLPLSLTSTDAISGLLLSLQSNDLPIDYLDRREEGIQKTTVEDIRRVAQKLLDPSKFLTVLVGRTQDIENTIQIETLPNVE